MSEVGGVELELAGDFLCGRSCQRGGVHDMDRSGYGRNWRSRAPLRLSRWHQHRSTTCWAAAVIDMDEPDSLGSTRRGGWWLKRFSE